MSMIDETEQQGDVLLERVPPDASEICTLCKCNQPWQENSSPIVAHGLVDTMLIFVCEWEKQGIHPLLSVPCILQTTVAPEDHASVKQLFDDIQILSGATPPLFAIVPPTDADHFSAMSFMTNDKTLHEKLMEYH